MINLERVAETLEISGGGGGGAGETVATRIFDALQPGHAAHLRLARGFTSAFLRPFAFRRRDTDAQIIVACARQQTDIWKRRFLLIIRQNRRLKPEISARGVEIKR